MTKTVWTTKTVAARAGLSKRDEADEVSTEATQTTDTEPEAAADSEAESSEAESHLYKRHLCPTCPSGASVSGRNLFIRTFGDYLGLQYCCPSRPSGSRTTTVYRTVTKTQQRQPGNQKTKKPNIVAKATHIGIAFTDNNNDKKWTAGIDDPITGQWVVIRLGKTVLGRAKTDARGRYVLVTKAYPNRKIQITLMRAPRVVARIVTTGRNGGSSALIPIPPPTIKVTAFYDTNSNGKQSANEKAAAGITVLIKFTNGTLWKKVKLNGKGIFSASYRYRLPANTRLNVQTADGKVSKQFKTDGDGNLIAILPIPVGLLGRAYSLSAVRHICLTMPAIPPAAYQASDFRHHLLRRQRERRVQPG